MIFLIGIVLLLLCSGILSGGETALFSLSPVTLKAFSKSENPRLRRVALVMERPREILVSIMILNVLMNLLVQNTVANFFGRWESWLVKVGMPLVLVLVFGEVLPKSIALPSNQAFAPRFALWIEWASRFLRPLQKPLTQATDFLSHFFFGSLKKEPQRLVEELRHMLQSSKRKSILLPQECDLIEGALDLQEKSVKELMRPREEILFYDLRDPLAELLHLFVEQEISRVPVCDGDLEKLLGVLSIDRYFAHREEIRESKDLILLLKKAYFTPETTRAWALLKNLREKQESLAIVVDEYGSISGLIAQEDLMEKVVGEVVDKRDEVRFFTRSSSDVIIASGKLELAEFQEIFGIPLISQSHVVTLGGWLIEQLGDIPSAGTKYVTENFLFYVLEADPNRVRRIYVRKLGPS